MTNNDILQRFWDFAETHGVSFSISNRSDKEYYGVLKLGIYEQHIQSMSLEELTRVYFTLTVNIIVDERIKVKEMAGNKSE